MSILIINCCTAKQKVEAKETNQLYSYVDSKSGLCGFVDKKGKVIIDILALPSKLKIIVKISFGFIFNGNVLAFLLLF